MQPTRAGHVVGLVPIAVVVAALAGQDAGQQRPTFVGGVHVVTTDVIVRDDEGRFVPTLTASDFRVLEDGVEQTITHFAVWVGGRDMTPMTGVPRPVTEGLVLPPDRPATDVSGRIFIVFIDDLHVQPSDTARLRSVIRQIRDELIHENDLVGIVSTGPSSIAVDLTYDVGHRRLNEAIDRVMGGADTPADILEMPESSEGVAHLRYNASVAFRTAYGILDQAEQISDRRTAFLYVSSGYAFNPFRDARFEQAKERYEYLTASSGDPDRTKTFTNPFDTAAVFSELDLTAQVAELARRAERASVTFYPIDPRGLTAGPAINDRLTPEDWRAYVTDSISTLQILGNETGGFALVNTNDYRPGLQRIDAEMSDYYVIGYESTNPDPLRVRRQITITVPARPELELRYHDSYTIDRGR